MSLWEFRVELLPGDVERVDEALAEMETSDWNIVEEVPAGRAVLVGFFSSEAAGAASWEEMGPILPARVARKKPDVRPVEESQWRDSYKAHFHAWSFRDIHWVPVWERDTAAIPEGGVVIWLDPGMAFGTGNHETTRLCLEQTIAFRDHCRESGRDLSGGNVIDAGCGSGILAISAVKCGFGEAIGFDNDPVAVAAARDNAEMNGMGDSPLFFEADLVSGLEGRSADLVLANIQADVLVEFSKSLAGAVREDGRLVLSGILREEAEQVRAAFAEACPTAGIDQFDRGEWCALVLQF